MATGTVRPEVGAEVKVGPRISGVLEELLVHVGDSVRAGDLLARLDDAKLRANVQAAEAELAAARAAVGRAETQVVRASALLARRETLANGGLVSAEDLELQQRDLDIAHAEAGAAQARLRVAQTRLRSAQIELGYATIQAPISGTVTTVATREGEAVAASFTVPTFVTIMDLDRLEVETYVDEVDIGKVAVGQEAEISLDAFPNETFAGEVCAVSPEARVRDNVVTYVVLVRITDGDRGLLRPQMTASITISAGARRGLLLVPIEAVRRDDAGRPYVLVSRSDTAERRPVRLGQMYGSQVEVRSGLDEGEQAVAVEPMEKERSG
jgi:RND family efflux transporter MFP subunit